MQVHDPTTSKQADDGLGVREEPLDAANQSLADALRASFRILKGIMLLLVLLYLVSNVRRIESHEQALLLRLGDLAPGVHEAGLVWAFPFPIDEIVPLPTMKSNDLTVDSHTFKRRPEEIGKPLSFISPRSGGLHPIRDGALLAADGGLVHVRWKVTYKIDDVRSYVSNIVSDKLEAAEDLIQTMVETIGIHVASEMTAEEIIRTRVDHVQSQMIRRVNARLAELNSGLSVKRIEMFEPTPPLAVRDAFDNTQRAENLKQKKIRDAEQARTKTLNEAAGAAYTRLISLLDEVERLERADTETSSAAARQRLKSARAELSRTLERDVEGQAGRMIKDAGSYLSVVVGQMQGDVEEYRTLLPEYRRNPAMLIGRLWEETREEILNYSGVTKIFRPPGVEIRIKIPFDPRQAKTTERERLAEQEFDPSKLRPKRYVPVGWEHE